MIEKIKAIPIYKLIIDIVCIVIALFGVIVSIKMNFVGRSLWFDEAALAYSFVQRGFSELTATGLDLVQSAPVGWLYVLKIICAIFGYTDFVMRVPSILAYLGMLCLTYYISHKIIKIYYAFAPVAFAASLPLLLQYSNVFKPYISDAFFALLILCLFYWYKEKKLNIFVLAVIWGVILWFSSTACFVEGGVIIASFIMTLINRDKKTVKKDIINLVIIGVIIVVFFGIYYIYWLGKVDDGMHGFWADWSFKFIPLSMDDLRHMKKMISTLFDPFYYFKAVTFILFIVGFIVSIIKKNQYILSVYTTFLVTAFASSIGMYPVNKRLWLFIYPMIIIQTFYVLNFTCDKTEDKKSVRNAIVGIVLMCMCFCNAGIRYYMHDENVYWPGYEVKGEYNYLQSVINEGDKIYVTAAARPMFLFYNHYDNTRLEGTDNEVFVGGNALNETFLHDTDFAYINGNKPCYIVMSDTWDEPEQYGLMFDYLEDKGSLEMVYNEYDTPLFYFIPNGAAK